MVNDDGHGLTAAHPVFTCHILVNETVIFVILK